MMAMIAMMAMNFTYRRNKAYEYTTLTTLTTTTVMVEWPNDIRRRNMPTDTDGRRQNNDMSDEETVL